MVAEAEAKPESESGDAQPDPCCNTLGYLLVTEKKTRDGEWTRLVNH